MFLLVLHSVVENFVTIKLSQLSITKIFSHPLEKKKNILKERLSKRVPLV
jgi:hypothetical protein